jgi:hypothetical protein
MWKRKIILLTVILLSAAGILTIYLEINPRIFSIRKNSRSSIHLTKHYPVPDNFNSREIKSLKRRALLGDGQAADHLREIYSNCLAHYAVANAPRPTVSEANCEREHYHWVEVAAINGSMAGIIQQYNFQAESADCEDVYRAGYWFRKIPHEHMTEELRVSEAKRQAQREKACGW